MSGRGGDSRSYRDRSRSRSRSRARAYRDDYRERSRERPGRGDIDTRERRDEGRHGRSRSRSRSPRRRSQSRSRYRSRSRQRRRSRSHSSERDRGKRVDRSRERRRRSRSRSRSVSSTDSSSSDHRHHRKKDKRHKRKRSKSRDKERKKEKKDKKKKKNVGAVSNQWGKYGIITETDMFTKETEFRTWLVEERKINPETISKDQTRKEFAKFVEDFNTATLPHEKFYDMTKYEARMAALRSGEFVPPADDSYDPNADMLVLQSHQRDKRKAKDSSDTYLSKDQLMELRKVQAERIEVGKMKLLGMDIKQNMGVRMDGSTFDE